MQQKFIEYLDKLEYFFIEKNNNHFILRNFILNSVNKYKSVLNDEARKYSQNDLLNNESHFPTLLIDFNIYYPNDIEYLSILQLYTNFELTLRNLCDSISQYTEGKLKHKDFRGDNTIDSFRKYLIYCCNFDIKDFLNWELLEEFRLIRNLIAHSNGFLDERNNNKLSRIISEIKSAMNNTYWIMKPKDYIPTAKEKDLPVISPKGRELDYFTTH